MLYTLIQGKLELGRKVYCLQLFVSMTLKDVSKEIKKGCCFKKGLCCFWQYVQNSFQTNKSTDFTYHSDSHHFKETMETQKMYHQECFFLCNVQIIF